MELAVGTFINVLVLSSVYILVGLGFVLLFSIMGILNLAHGAIYMVGAYVGYQFAVALGLNQWLALLLTVLLFAAFGIFLEKFLFRPLVGNFDSTLMVCIAIAVILQTTVNILVGYKIQALPPFVEGILRIGLASVSYGRIVTFAIGAVLLAAITWFVNRTKWGQQMQAIAQDMEGASLQGISIHRISGLATAIACGLAALAGCLMGAYLSLTPFMGDYILIKVLILVILAGVGSISGIFYAGMLLGVLDGILPLFMSGAASEAITIGIVVVLLLIRPQGFFGREME
jgi:branched-chain amino acid transport system permease protein